MIRLKVLNLIVALYVTGCGAEEAKQAPSQVGSKPSSPVATVTKEPVTYHNRINSLAVAEVKSLPACDGASEGELAFVRADKTFYACEGGAWGEIDVRGDKGLQGEAGQKGDTGAQGVAGVDGKVVTAPLPELAPNEFLEGGSGLVWVKGTISVLFADAQAICAAVERRLPTEKELQRGYILGTLKGVGSQAAWIWADSGREVRSDGGSIEVETTDKGLPYCVKDAP